MDYKRFLEKVKKIVTTDEQPHNCEYEPKGDYLTHSYETGGESGGNCWNRDEAAEYTTEIIDDDFVELETILTEMFPQITYIQFKEINREVKHSDYTEYEYYGNCTYNTVKYIDVRKLYTILTGMELL